MGYTTEFDGRFNLDKPLTVPQFNYLKAFNETRHMRRNADALMLTPDPLRVKVGLPLGNEGEYYVADESQAVLVIIQTPTTQPGLWCKWVPTEDGEGIEWDNNEKFYDYIEWLEYIIENFLKPWGLTLSGTVTWEGESNSDIGKIVVTDNKVASKKVKITYEDTEEE